MNHLIMKQEFALRIDARVDAFRVQQDVRTYYYEKVLPILERLFDEISSSDKVIAINRLAIDLGALGWKEGRIMMDTDVIYRVCKQQLEQQLHSAIDVPKDKLVTRRTEEEHACLQWIFYMEQGVLPWALKEINHAWLVKVIHQLAIDHAMISRLRSLILVDTDALVRIVRDHDDIFLLQLAEVLTGLGINILFPVVISSTIVLKTIQCVYQVHKSGWSQHPVFFIPATVNWWFRT